jgi:hypothetical protein
MKHATSGKLENIKQLRLMNFFAIPLKKKASEPNISSQIARTTEVTQKQDTNTSFRYIQRVKRWKFKEEWCKEIKWLNFYHSICVVR